MIAEDRQNTVFSGNLQHLDTVRAAIDEVADSDDGVPGSGAKAVNEFPEFVCAAMNISDDKGSSWCGGQCLYPELAHRGPR